MTFRVAVRITKLIEKSASNAGSAQRPARQALSSRLNLIDYPHYNFSGTRIFLVPDFFMLQAGRRQESMLDEELAHRTKYLSLSSCGDSHKARSSEANSSLPGFCTAALTLYSVSCLFFLPKPVILNSFFFSFFCNFFIRRASTFAAATSFRER